MNRAGLVAAPAARRQSTMSRYAKLQARDRGYEGGRGEKKMGRTGSSRGAEAPEGRGPFAKEGREGKTFLVPTVWGLYGQPDSVMEAGGDDP